MGCLNDKLYIIGHHSYKPIFHIFIYDDKCDKWIKLDTKTHPNQKIRGMVMTAV